MDKRLSISTQTIEACEGDVAYLLDRGENWRVTISEAELERCSGRIEQAIENCKDVVLRVYLLGAANAFHALHETKREDDEETMFTRVMMHWRTDTGDYTDEHMEGGDDGRDQA